MTSFQLPTGLLPHRIRNTLLRDVRDTEPMRQMRAFVADDRATLAVLAGDPGLGKSFAAGWAMQFMEYVERLGAASDCRSMHLPMWTTSADLVCTAEWHTADLVAALTKPRLLVIDDLGNEPLTGKATSILQHILSSRHNDDRVKTVLTTNLPPKVFGERYSARIRSRVRESGLNADGSARWWLDCTGNDLRGLA